MNNIYLHYTVVNWIDFYMYCIKVHMEIYNKLAFLYWWLMETRLLRSTFLCILPRLWKFTRFSKLLDQGPYCWQPYVKIAQMLQYWPMYRVSSSTSFKIHCNFFKISEFQRNTDGFSRFEFIFSIVWCFYGPTFVPIRGLYWRTFVLSDVCVVLHLYRVPVGWGLLWNVIFNEMLFWFYKFTNLVME